MESFGRDRVFNTPISEACICGTGIGLAMIGLRPVMELMYFDFALMSSDQISNQAAKWHYMSGAQTEVPLVLRVSAGAGKGYGGQHSQTLESMFCHIPGLYVVYPATPYDAKGMLKSAIRDNNPVMFIESQGLYGMKGAVPENEYLVPLGVAEVKREGSDITFVTWGPLVHDCLKAADKLKAEKNVSAEVIDLRSLVPLDLDTILRSVQKTGRCVVASQAIHIGSYTGEIASTISDAIFDYLDAPVKRVGAKNGIAPQSHILEAAFLPERQRPPRRRQRHPVRNTMATPIIMPKFGQMTEESAIVEWLKKEGDKVAKGDILFTVETDKSVMEVESFEEGTLLKIIVPPGINVPVQSTVGFLGKPGEPIPAITAPAPAAPKAASRSRQRCAQRAARPAAKRADVRRSRRSAASRSIRQRSGSSSPLFRISPRAAALAKHSVIDATRIKGTGPEGRVVEKDVRNYLQQHGYDKLRISPAAKELAAKEKLDVLTIQATDDSGRITVADVAARPRRAAEADEQDAAGHRATAHAKLPRHAAFLRHRRGGHDRLDRLPQPAQGGGRALHRHRFHRRGGGADVAGIPRREQLDRRQDHALEQPRQPRHRRFAGTGPRRAGHPRCRAIAVAGTLPAIQGARRKGARRQGHARRIERRHVHHLQHGHDGRGKLRPPSSTPAKAPSSAWRAPSRSRSCATAKSSCAR